MRVFMATLGERPEAITVALDRLRERYEFDLVVILQTDPQASRIGTARDALADVLAADYAALPVHWRTLDAVGGGPLIDITDQTTANDYYYGVLAALVDYQRAGYALHLLVSGGRKAMSIYATLAAGVVFHPPQDKVWTVLSPPHLLQNGMWHIPPGERDQVHVVDMPLITARLAPGADPQRFIESARDEASLFMAKLSTSERELAQTLRSHPDATNAELAAMLHKSEKTVENQFSKIYMKMMAFFNLGETIRHPRRALLDLMREER